MDRTGIGLLLVCLLCVPMSVLCQNMVNVAPGKTCSQSTKYQSQGPSCNAANRNTGGRFDSSSNNCIHTLGNTYWSNRQKYTDYTPWWEVDLGRTFPVQDINVWTRTGFNGRLYPFNITVDDQLCVRVSDNGYRWQSVRCGSVMYGQVVRLTKYYTDIPDNTYLNLCELEVLVPSGVSQCPAGSYGQGCGLTCSSNCGGGLGKNFCNNNSAVCYDGCFGNFAGDFCTDCMENFTGNRCQDCTVGNYGTNCGSTCYFPCAGGCARDTGYCTRCVDRRWGQFCQQTCPDNCYGNSCRRDNGHCYSCAGNFAGDTCTACGDGWYGDNCTARCGTCDGGVACNKSTGHCPCPAGKQPPLCDTDCKDNKYGKDCLASCGQCQWEQPCDTVTGECPADCLPGWNGTRCDEKAKPATSQENKDDGATNLVGPMVGAIVGVGLVMTISITAAICWRRKSATSRSSGQDPTTTSSSVKDAAPTVSPEPSPLRQSSSNEDNLYSEIRDPDDTYAISEMQSIYDKPSPYSNDDGDREPYMQLTSKTNDVNMPASNAAYVNTKLSV